MTEWLEPEPVPVPEEVLDAAGGNPLVAKILLQRGVTETGRIQAYLDPVHYSPASPYDLPDMESAVQRLQQALRQGERICVWGDFDVDGQTSTTLLVDSLRRLGGKVSYHIPLRATEGHGIQLSALQTVLDAGVDLLVTCDTGIGAHAAVEAANSRGVAVIVTDHHEPAATFPPALAVINPHRLPENHPLSYLPGVGVAYQLIAALSSACGQPELAERQLDLVALGIVADVALLHGDCRYLLQRGLERLRQPQRVGLQALYERAGLNPAGITEEHIGFVIGPRLNAIGRLGDANPVVDFLTTDDQAQANVFALQLEALNARRKLLSEQIYAGAEAQLERQPELLQDAALVLAHPEWPPGVIGIVASRLVERYARPVILLNGPEEGPWRGSARSIPPVNITAAIAAQGDLLDGFGGHAMAAGMQIKAGCLEEFRRRLSAAVQAALGEQPYDPRLAIDAYLPLDELNLDWVQQIERLAPFGAGAPALTLATNNLHVHSSSYIGREQEHRLVTVADDQGHTRRVLWWSSGDLLLPEGAFDLAYTARTSSFRGLEEVQVEWRDARLHPEIVGVAEAPPPAIEIVDLRRAPQPEHRLYEILESYQAPVWGEADAVPDLKLSRRHELSPAAALAIWTAPPGPQILHQAVQAVDPHTVYFFAVDPGLDRFQPFITRLAGLVKHTLSKSAGAGEVEKLAAAMAHRPETILSGLDCLAAQGFISYTKLSEKSIQIISGNGRPQPGLPAAIRQLKHQLAETAAFRNYLHWADVSQIANYLNYFPASDQDKESSLATKNS